MDWCHQATETPPPPHVSSQHIQIKVAQDRVTSSSPTPPPRNAIIRRQAAARHGGLFALNGISSKLISQADGARRGGWRRGGARWGVNGISAAAAIDGGQRRENTAERQWADENVAGVAMPVPTEALRWCHAGANQPEPCGVSRKRWALPLFSCRVSWSAPTSEGPQNH